MAVLSCTLLDGDDTINFLNQAVLRRMTVSDVVLVAGNGQAALDLLRTTKTETSKLSGPLVSVSPLF